MLSRFICITLHTVIHQVKKYYSILKNCSLSVFSFLGFINKKKKEHISTIKYTH